MPFDSHQSLLKSLAEQQLSSKLLVPVGSLLIVLALANIYREDPIFASVSLKQKIRRIGGAWPFIGDTLAAADGKSRIHDFICDIFEKGNNEPFVLKFPLFEGPIIVFNDPKMVEYFLKTKFGVFEKGPMFRSRAHDTLGHGIFASDGASWKSQRKLAANIFNVKNFKDFVNQVFSAEMESLSSVLAQYANKTSGQKEFDLQDLFFKFTFDSFTKIGFGIEMHSLSASDTDIPFMSAFDRAQLVVANRFLTPLWGVVEYVSGSGKRHACDVKIIREFGSEVIRQKRNTAPSQNQEFDQDENDLLSLLMKVKDETGETPTDELLVDYVLNFLIAGRDTTAQALSWCFYLLHRHPKALKCLQKEIEAIVGGLQPTYEQIKSQMPYANAVFHETLRLYPSVPLEMKQASANDTLPDGTFVPKGCMVAWSPYAMGRTEAIWGKDAKEFRPERWLEMDKQPSPFDYPVFNAGPRVCLGKSMAELEGVFVLVEVVRQFEIQVVKEEDVTYSFSLTLPMKNGLKVTCKARS